VFQPKLNYPVQDDNVEISLRFCNIHNASRIYLSGISPQMRDLAVRWLASDRSMGIQASGFVYTVTSCKHGIRRARHLAPGRTAGIARSDVVGFAETQPAQRAVDPPPDTFQFQKDGCRRNRSFVRESVQRTRRDCHSAARYCHGTRLFPDLVEAQLNLGLIYKMAGDRARARSCFEAFFAKASPPEYRQVI
jgi:hypothetical protein